MNNPYLPKLGFFEKIKYYSLLRKLDEQTLIKIRLFLQSEEELYEKEDYFLPGWEAEKKLLFVLYGLEELGLTPLKENDLLEDEELYRKRYIKSIEEMHSNLNFIQSQEKLNNIEEKPIDAIESELALLKEKFLKSNKEKRDVLKKAFPENINRFKKLEKCKLKNFLLCQNEVLNIGAKNILNALFEKGFLAKKKEKYYLTPSGIKMGELLWFLFYVKKEDPKGKFTKLYGNRPINRNREISEIIFRLKKKSLSIFIIQVQIVNFYLFLILLFFLMGFLILEKTYIIENSNQNPGQNNQVAENLKTFFSLLFLVTIGIFVISFMVDYLYRKVQKSKACLELKNKIFEQK